MKTYTRIVIGVIAILFVSSFASAQNLLDNEEFRRARELQRQAQEAFDAGRFNESIELSEEAEAAAERGQEIAERTRDGFRAANARTIARDRLSQAQSLNIESELPDVWAEAQTAFDRGQEEYADEEFVPARSSFLSLRDSIITDDVLSELRTIGGLRIEAAEARSNARTRLDRAEELGIAEEFPDIQQQALDSFASGNDAFDSEQWEQARDNFRSVLNLIDANMLAELQERQRARAAADQEAVLPEFYIVRRIPERRDSFWRIAEYEFIYNNPCEWQRIFEANRDLLQDPDNPDLIQPGMRFRIPPLDGETRSGTWNPEDAR